MKKKTKLLLFLTNIIVLSFLLWGCGGGSAGMSETIPEGSTPAQSGGNSTETSNDIAAYQNTKAWNEFSTGNYTEAKKIFNNNLSSGSAAVKSEAMAGYGWCLLQEGSVTDSIPYLEQGKSSSNDAKAGLASAYMAEGSSSNIEKIISSVREIGGTTTNFVFTPKLQSAVGNAEVHAMLAYAYYMDGNDSESAAQIEYINTLPVNERSSSTVKGILDTLTFCKADFDKAR